MKYTYYGKIEDGKLVFDYPHMMKDSIVMCPDMRVKVTLEKEGTDPSLEQWKYLYAVVYKIFGDNYGWTIDAVDVYMKQKFMAENLIVLPKGLILTKSSFQREGLVKYMDSCIRFAAEEGVSVPPPNKNWRKELKG